MYAKSAGPRRPHSVDWVPPRTDPGDAAALPVASLYRLTPSEADAVTGEQILLPTQPENVQEREADTFTTLTGAFLWASKSCSHSTH